MKKLLTLLFIALILLFGMTVANSAPMYYSFTGAVSSISEDACGIISAAGITSGDSVDYIFIVDFGEDG